MINPHEKTNKGTPIQSKFPHFYHIDLILFYFSMVFLQ